MLEVEPGENESTGTVGGVSSDRWRRCDSGPNGGPDLREGWPLEADL